LRWYDFLKVRVINILTDPGKATSSIWRAWLPALCWLTVIAVESTNAFSAEKTGAMLYPLFHYLFGLDLSHFAKWHFVLRKTGHVVGYTVLSLLLFRAWRLTLPVRETPRWSMVWGRTAFFMTMLVAALDEWHQTLLPSRTGTPRDVLLDSAAALGAQVLLYLWLRGWRNQGDPSFACRTTLQPRGDDSF
jgi:VanZ family protein